MNLSFYQEFKSIPGSSTYLTAIHISLDRKSHEAMTTWKTLKRIAFHQSENVTASFVKLVSYRLGYFWDISCPNICGQCYCVLKVADPY